MALSLRRHALKSAVFLTSQTHFLSVVTLASLELSTQTDTFGFLNLGALVLEGPCL